MVNFRARASTLRDCGGAHSAMTAQHAAERAGVHAPVVNAARPVAVLDLTGAAELRRVPAGERGHV